jgi:hypothetical protein
MNALQNKKNSLPVRKAPDGIYTKFHSTNTTNPYWFAVMARYDVDVQGTKTLHTAGGFDFWAWNVGSPLLPFEIPPFRFPMAHYDLWLLDMMIQTGYRNAIDITEVAEIFHQEHVCASTFDNWVDALDVGLTGVFMNRFHAYSEPRTLLAGTTDDNKSIYHVRVGGSPEGCPWKAYSNMTHDCSKKSLLEQFVNGRDRGQVEVQGLAWKKLQDLKERGEKYRKN